MIGRRGFIGALAAVALAPLAARRLAVVEPTTLGAVRGLRGLRGMVDHGTLDATIWGKGREAPLTEKMFTDFLAVAAKRRSL